MSSISFYRWWLIRSRLVAIIGAAISIWATWSEELCGSDLGRGLTYCGFVILVIGVLDASALLQRKKVLDAIKKEQQNG